MLRKIRVLTRPYWDRIAGGIVLSVVISGITGAIAWSIKPAFDEIFVGKQYQYLAVLPLGVLLLFVLKGVISFGQAYLMKSAGMKLVRDTRNRLYSHMLCLPISFLNKESSGVIISRTMNDAEHLNALISNVIKTFVVEVPTVIFLLGVALYRKWDLALMTLILLPLIAYSARRFGKRVKKKRKSAQAKLSFLTHRVGESVQGARIIKVFNRERAMADRFIADNQRYYRELLRVVRSKEFANLVSDVATGVGIALVLWYGGGMVRLGTITPGDFASIITAIYMIFSPAKKISDAYTTLQETRASIERIDTLLEAGHEEQAGTRLEGFHGSLVFDHVSFAYDDSHHPVLKDVSLEVKPGEVIAIVGRSGVGKSTLVDLIPRFNKPSSGIVSIDGADICGVDLTSLRALIGIVSQDIILFNDTVKENIAFGRPGASDGDIRAAAALAHADEFIERLPEEYDTVIGERGYKLSGGQRQRLAIARAVLKNPPILILDEATSSLDSLSERLVQEALDELMQGRTTFVIAHRLSTVRHADRIVVLDRGEIIDVGSHEQLMARSETYAKLYSAFALS